MNRFSRVVCLITHTNVCLRVCTCVPRHQHRPLSTTTKLAAKDVSTTKSKTSESAKESESFMMNLFRGKVETSQLFPYPKVLNDEQRETLQLVVGPAEKFFEEEVDSIKLDAEAALDEKTMNGLKELGAFGMQVPVELGGVGMNNTQYAKMCEIIGANDLGVGVTLGAHQSIGFKGILLYGNEEQRQKYLPKVATGEYIAAFALTEPASGSDASSIRSRAVLSDDKKHFILNGSKIWISNGGIAEIFTVFAQTPVKDEKTGAEKDKVTAFVVERSYGGITSGPPENKMGIKASNTTEVHFEDVKIPVDNVLGGVGNGFKVAMNILNSGRFGIIASMTGTMKMAIKKAVEHATTRKQFGNFISEYGSIQEKIARMSMLEYVSESMAYMVSSNMDRGSKDIQVEAAVSKIFGSEAAWYVVDEAIQILGGMGYMKETELERFVRDIRIFRIFEGANDILRLFISLTGIQYAGSHLKELQKAFSNPMSNIGLIVGEAAKRAKRSVGLESPPVLSPFVHPNLASSADLVAKTMANFSITVESLLMKHGRSIVDQQFILCRLANVAIDIYGMASVLSRVTESINKGMESAHREELMTRVWCNEAAERSSYTLLSVKSSTHLENFKNMSIMAKEVYKNNGEVAVHPLEL